MKWFLELGSCWGGATVTPSTETAQTSSTMQLEEVNRAPIRGRSRNKATVHWKPKLHVISEDIVMMTDVNKRNQQQRTIGPDKKPTVKVVKPKSKAKVPKPTSYGEDYWNSSHPMSVAAFSPTPFLF